MLLHSKTLPFGFTAAGSSNNFSGTKKLYFRHFDEHLQPHFRPPLNPSCPVKNSPLSLNVVRTRFLSPVKCSYSSSSSTDSSKNYPFLEQFKGFSFDKVKATLLQVTPFDVVKWSGILSIALAATKWTVNFVLSPFFWMYFSLTWLFWPWYVAVALGFYGIYGYYKHSLGQAGIIEQLAVVSSFLTWLTLVPAAHVNGYLQGWPVLFFFVYHYFFFLNVTVRKRLYGDFYVRSHDAKWDLQLPGWQRCLLCIAIMAGHWFAAFEGPEYQLIPGGWRNVGVWIFILVSVLLHYYSTLYLAKYSKKVVEPYAVVIFGPYRWVRHPLYLSIMILLATYFVALRAPLSCLFVVVVCAIYYEQKAKMEEALMIEAFGELYLEYMNKVRYKFIPFLY